MPILHLQCALYFLHLDITGTSPTNKASAITSTTSVLKEQQQQYSATSVMSSSTSARKTAKISNASTVSNASSNLTVPPTLCGLSDDEGTYQALSVVFEDATNPRKTAKKSKG